MSQMRAEGSWATLWWVDVFYSAPDEEEEVDETFFKQLEEASFLQALVHTPLTAGVRPGMDSLVRQGGGDAHCNRASSGNAWLSALGQVMGLL